MNKYAIKLSDSYKKTKRGWHASSRIRGHWLAKYWDELDDIFYPEYFEQEYNEFFETENQLEILEKYDVVIIHKAYETELIKALHDRGQKIVIDLSDPDYLLGFSNVGRAGQCLTSLAHSDACVVNNKKMIEDLKKGYDKPIFYIPDRIDPEIIEPQEIVKEIVWYGHSDNHESIKPLIKSITKQYKLKIISDKPIEGTLFVEYNPATINEEIKKSDAVILGYKMNEYKSSNREQLAIALNMPVIDHIFLNKLSIEESVKEWKNLLNKI